MSRRFVQIVLIGAVSAALGAFMEIVLDWPAVMFWILGFVTGVLIQLFASMYLRETVGRDRSGTELHFYTRQDCIRRDLHDDMPVGFSCKHCGYTP